MGMQLSGEAARGEQQCGRGYPGETRLPWGWGSTARPHTGSGGADMNTWRMPPAAFLHERPRHLPRESRQSQEEEGEGVRRATVRGRRLKCTGGVDGERSGLAKYG
jgi:hypothetical protein